MIPTKRLVLKLLCLGLAALAGAAQPVDEAYTAKIREYTTEPFFLTDLVETLPASASVPTPHKALGYIAGAAGKLTYSRDIYRYFRELERTSPRVKVFSMGQTEEGREMLLAAISDESNVAKLETLRQNARRLADPRKLTEKEASALINEGVPAYWITGGLHPPETGAPEMLMELAYRLAVAETPLVRNIRRNVVVLITPILEVDGRDRQVDLYNYRLANPDRTPPSLVYWGKYVAHDNNRDGIAMALALTRHVTRAFLEWHPLVLHDLHESIPFLYTSTGMGPYNAWLDPIVINEWQKLAYHEVEELTKRGVPGVWTHGFYDGWAANYLFTVAHGHNAIGRFYETFGNRVADTMDRTVPESQTTRTWFRPNPPLPKVRWSLRNNVNLQQSGLLLALNYTATNRREFLENFYLKSKRSVAKARNEGPAAWVIPADDPRPLECAELVNLLRAHGIEVHRLSNALEKPLKVPAQSYVIRMDQPYSRMADMLFDTQYYNPGDTRPYDDTGWSVGALRNIRTVRVTDASILDAPMTLITAAEKPAGGVQGPANASVYVVQHNAENALATFRFRLRDVSMSAARAPFEAEGREYNAGSFIIKAGAGTDALRRRLDEAAAELGLAVHGLSALPEVPMHALAAPRIALVHSWLNTQSEGWFRLAFDKLGVPYDYISDQALRTRQNLRERYDVIVYGPTPGSAQRIVNGIPRGAGDPIPWKASPLTPNLATSPDTTEDMRGGPGLEGMVNLRTFVEQGGLFITIAGNAAIPIDFGLVEGVSISATRELQTRGSVLQTVIADKQSPVTYGFGERLSVHFNQGPVFRTSLTGGMQAPAPEQAPAARPSGRGSATDPDVPQGRPYTPPPAKPKLQPGEEPPLTEEMRESLRAFLPPAAERPRTLMRFADEKELLVSGLLAGGRELAHRPAVVQVPRGQGNVLLFAFNPIWRHQTQGSFFLVFNALLNFDNLSAGARTETPAEQPARSGSQ